MFSWILDCVFVMRSRLYHLAFSSSFSTQTFQSWFADLIPTYLNKNDITSSPNAAAMDVLK